MPKTAFSPCKACGKTNHSTEKSYSGATAAKKPPLLYRRPEGQKQVQERANENDSNEIDRAAAHNINKRCHMFTLELRLTDRRPLTQHFHQSQRLSGLQPQETHLVNIQKTPTTETHKSTHASEFKERNDVESQT